MEVTQTKRLGKGKPNSHSKERDLGERKSKIEEKNQRENPCTNSKKHEEKEGHDFLDNCTSIVTQILVQLHNN